MTRKIRALTFLEFLVVLALVAIVVALLLPLKRTARGAARRNTCQNNLKQIALAILMYESDKGTLPPAYTVDLEGNRLHSWRTLILPYMEQQRLFNSIDLSKPWDDPVNAKARETVVESYSCPSVSNDEGLTTYLGIFGPSCVFSGPVPLNITDVKDGPSNTIMVVDIDVEKAIHWMSPHDISEEEIVKHLPGADMQHPRIITTAFLDGHSLTISQEIDSEVLRSMFTIAGGEAISDGF